MPGHNPEAKWLVKTLRELLTPNIRIGSNIGQIPHVTVTKPVFLDGIWQVEAECCWKSHKPENSNIRTFVLKPKLVRWSASRLK